MNRTKYDGKLTDALIQTVIDAENRQNELIADLADIATIGPVRGDRTATGIVAMANRSTGLPGGKATIVSEVETSRLAELADYQRTTKPTPAEKAEAWARNHRDYVPPEGVEDGNDES